ncbi:MAG: hypothetical protein Q4G02_04165 [bacterium]|nr:hypothetical protein [bacterium]
MKQTKLNICKIIFGIFCCFLWLRQPIWADDGFVTQLQANYTISETETTQVELKFKLINTSPTTYVESYRLIVPEKNVSGLVLQQEDQNIEKTLTTENGQNIFDLRFLNQVVGQGKARTFTVEYNDAGLVEAKGKNIIVRLPSMNSEQPYQKYQAVVTLPTSFGDLAKVTPEASKVLQRAGQTIYTFDLSTPQEILFQFGQEQLSQFSFEKTLSNQTNYAAYQQINLPLDDQNQQFLYAYLTPTPDYYRIENGVWQAFYLLKPWTDVNVNAAGYVRVWQVDENYFLSDHLPSDILSVWQSFFVEEIPQDFLALQVLSPATVQVQNRLDQWWILPLPGHFLVDVYNQTGQVANNLNLRVTTNTDSMTVEPAETIFSLLPWQKTTLPVRVQSQNWWPLYQEVDLKLTLTNSNGEILHESEQTGLSLAYRTLALIGGFFAAAVTGGSILVARRQEKSSLRR